MREKEFDQFFRDKLTEHSSPVPEDMWQRIQGKKDDRRALAFWWWGLGAGLPIIGLLIAKMLITPAIPSKTPAATPATSHTTSNTHPVAPSTTSTTPGRHPKFSNKNLTTPYTPDTAQNTPTVTLETTQRQSSHHPLTLADLKNKFPIKAPASKFPRDSAKNKKTLANLDLYGSPDNPYNAGLRLLIPLGNGKKFSVITGVQYTSVNRKVHRDSARFQNPRHLIEVPLLLSYTKELSPTKSISINTGVFLSNQSSLYLGLNLQKRLDPSWSVYAEPYYRYLFSRKEPSPLSAALSFGVRYTFKK
ncbi:MAG: hypothetical protein JST68_11445 [Bacteroidetes bacterium]|nr:hypothetical protein [Bacteroidota bacterium]